MTNPTDNATRLPPVTLDIDSIRDLADDAGSCIVAAYLPGMPIGLPTEVPVLINRKSGQALSVKHLFEEYREFPDRKKGTAKVTTLESFIDLVRRHKSKNSAIFADLDWKSPSLTAVIDYHVIDDMMADNGKHRIHYAFPLSEEWKAWVAQNGEVMAQAEFAEWIEDHIAELATPTEAELDQHEKIFGFRVATPAEIVTLSRGLKVNAETRVRSNVVLQSGEGEISFEEEHRDALGDKLVVPGLFMLQLPPFFMGAPARIPVRLRYRVHGGAVKWFFVLHRPDVHITAHINLAIKNAVGATELPVYCGAPEMPA